MKSYCKLIVILSLSLTQAAAFSQQIDSQKPAFFTSYPVTIDLSQTILENIFNIIKGQDINLAFSEHFIFPGTVLSNEIKYSNLQSVIIRSAAFGNSLFQLSKITNDDKTISYSGRILNPDARDGYQLKKDIKNNYTLNKIETRSILQDCSY